MNKGKRVKDKHEKKDKEKLDKEKIVEEVKKENNNDNEEKKENKKEKKEKGKGKGKGSKKNVILIIIIIIFIIAIIVSGFFIFKWMTENKKTEEILDVVSESINIDEADTMNFDVNFENLKKLNDDIVAYIKVKNTSIDYPVVQCGDNDYYITHSLDKSSNSAGWIFADYKNKFDTTDKNIVLYGHNRRDGTMFRTLRNALEEEWYTNPENQEITFVTENEKNKYQIFSIYIIENEDYYITTEFSKNEFKNFLKTIKSRSIHDFGVELNEDDQILTLSTCDNNNKYRLALHAKKIVE